MPIPFTCPHCGAFMNVDDRYAAQSGPCASCGQTIHIPNAPTGMPPTMPHGAVPPKKSSGAWLTCLIVLVVSSPILLACAGILVALLLPAVQAAREAARHAQCRNQMRHLAVAVQEYEVVEGEYPASENFRASDEIDLIKLDASDVEPEDEGPCFSWRVAILPHLGENRIHDQYDFDEPWDSDHNLQVASELEDNPFHCLSGKEDAKPVNGYLIPVTNYALVSGEGTIGAGGVTADDVLQGDGMHNTLMLVEITGDELPAWSEPIDVTLADLENGFVRGNRGETYGIVGEPFAVGSMHLGGVNAAYCDGHVESMPFDTPAGFLRSRGTYDGSD